MSFSVSYIYELQDKITPQLQNINAALKGTASVAKQASAEIGRASQMPLMGGQGLANTISTSINEAKKGSDKMKKFGQEVRNFGANMLIGMGIPLAGLGAIMVKAASDSEETANKFKEVFKGLDSEGEQAVGRLKENFKLSTTEVKSLMASIGDLMQGTGISRKETLKYAESIIALSTDVTSFKNVEGGAVRTVQALTAAMLGETERLKTTFEISLKQKDVQQEAIKLMSKRKDLTLESAKVLATFNLVQQKSKNAIGDFGRTLPAFANQWRVMQSNLKEVSAQFGKVLLPIVTKIVTKFNEFLKWMKELNPKTRRLVILIGGVTLAMIPLTIAIGSLIFTISLLAGAFGAISLPILGVVAALIVLGVLIVKYKKELLDFWNEYQAQILIGVGILVGALTIIFGPLALIIAAVVAIVALLVASMMGYGDQIAAAWTMVKVKMTGAIYQIERFFIESWESIKQAFADAWIFIQNNFSTGIDKLLEFIANFPSKFLETVVKIATALPGIFVDAWNMIVKFMTKAKDTLLVIWDKIKENFTFENILLGPVKMVEIISKKINDAIGGILTGGFQEQKVNKLADKVLNKAKAVGAAATAVFENKYDMLKRALGLDRKSESESFIGNMNVNFRNAPAGMTTSLQTGGTVSMNTGINTVFAGE